MTITQLIEEHEAIVKRLRDLQNGLLVAPDATLSLRDVLANLAGEEYAEVQMLITTGTRQARDEDCPVSIEWKVGIGKYSVSRYHKGPTLADAWRSYRGMKSEADPVGKAVEELTGEIFARPLEEAL